MTAVGAVLHKFCNVIQVGDAVITYDPNTREYLVGEITGPYRYDPSLKDHPNVPDVKWQSRVSRDALEASTRNSFGSTLTLFAISPEAWEDVQSVAAGTKQTSPEAEESEKPDFEELKRSREDEAHEALRVRWLLSSMNIRCKSY